MSGFLYKPIGQGQVGGGRATFLIDDLGLVSGGWYDAKGNLVERFNRFVGTPEEYIAKLVAGFAEVWRVLKNDGVLWLNLGDCYATGAGKVGDCPGGGEQGEK